MRLTAAPKKIDKIPCPWGQWRDRGSRHPKGYCKKLIE
ncbi:hypothetical protein D1AOALGA4SA_1101 [Olavius algarvensis Delta 1 endosymbiont]|nr:hypothetical protein D1AOALGA4SA_1101 [Olavius algarvensis Delta 1 endosymbiont]